MRMTPTPTASVAKRVQAHRDWRPLTTGEAVVAVVVDVLLQVVVVLVPLLALNVKALPWILLAQVIVVQGLVLARIGRTMGLATVSAAVVVPQQAAAPGIGRALARVLLPILLPFQVGRAKPGGQQGGAGEWLLDRLTGTLTVTHRPAPSRERQHPTAQTRTESRRTRRGSKGGASSPVAPAAATGRLTHDQGRRSSTGPMAAGAPMLHPQTPSVRKGPGLAGPVYTEAAAGRSTSVDLGSAVVSDSGTDHSRFAPPVPSSMAPSPAAPPPPPASTTPASAPAEYGPSPVSPSRFAAPLGPPATSSAPMRSASTGSPLPPDASTSAAPAPVEASAPLPPSLPPRIQPGQRQAVSPVSPSDALATPSVGGAPTANHGAVLSGDPSTSGRTTGSTQAQPPTVPPFTAASYPQQQVTSPVSGSPETSTPSESPSVQPGTRRRGRSDVQRRRPMVS